ncbi:MAG: YeeE/YedE family protein [Nitrospirae bacterium]|nr:YeeE/YedE family protein [Nitrospirota bacterium]
MERNNYWSPYIAGAGLGLTLLAAFYVMGKGLGASSAFSVTAAVAAKGIAPEYAGTLKYFSRYLSLESPLRDWIVFEMIGLFAGALAGALAGGNFRIRFDKGKSIGNTARLFTAFGGGMAIGFASRLARGCTSGVALSGGAQLAIAGWIFVISMFASGFVLAAFFRRLWQ